jgi:hypothetical protein
MIATPTYLEDVCVHARVQLLVEGLVDCVHGAPVTGRSGGESLLKISRRV